MPSSRHSRSRTRARSTCRANGSREPLLPPRSRVGSDTLFVVSTHLENRLGWLRGLFGDRARGRQAEALLQALPQGHGIVGGDFNTMLGPNEPAWRAMLGRFPDTPDRPEPTFRDRLVLDHLFFDLPDGWRGDAAGDQGPVRLGSPPGPGRYSPALTTKSTKRQATKSTKNSDQSLLRGLALIAALRVLRG